VLLNSPWRPVNVRSIAKFGDAYQRGTPWTRPGRLVSSGPFGLKEWNAHQHILVEKSPTYWDRANVRLNAIRFYPIDNIDAEERAFRAGQIHVTWALPLSKVLPLQRENSPALRSDPLLQTYFFRLNIRRAPFEDVRIRRALALSIDRQQLADKILPGGRQPAATLVPPFLKGYTPPAHTAYDLAVARQLLVEAGHAGGAGLPPIEILYNNSEILRQVAEAIQQMWHRDLGIDVRLVNQEYKVVMASRRAGDFQILLGDWTADYLDATTFTDLWRKDSGNNYTGWSDPAYDALATRADATVDPVARAAILAEEEALVLKAAPMIPIYFNTHVYLLSPSVKGWQPTPMDHIDFKYVWLEP
jgi:oligopeptide transport system substrate-binding protein